MAICAFRKRAFRSRSSVWPFPALSGSSGWKHPRFAPVPDPLRQSLGASREALLRCSAFAVCKNHLRYKDFRLGGVLQGSAAGLIDATCILPQILV